jgi:hypothetical protein
MSKILEAAARRPCPTCGGKKAVNPFDQVVEDCSDCQDSSGKPTGLWLPELTVECRCGYPDEYLCLGRTDNQCCWRCDCQGTGRVLSLTSDNIDAAMERLGWTNTHCTKRTDGFWWEYEHENWEVLRNVCRFASTRSAARIAAAETVVKAVWPEVEHDG